MASVLCRCLLEAAHHEDREEVEDDDDVVRPVEAGLRDPSSSPSWCQHLRRGLRHDPPHSAQSPAPAPLTTPGSSDIY